jgi:hypothetical protein
MSGGESKGKGTEPEHVGIVPSGEVNRKNETQKGKYTKKITYILCVIWIWIVDLFKVANVIALLLFCATLALYCATRDLVHDADNNARRQLRAHVLYDGISVTPRKPNAAIFVRFKNSGATPAYEATYWWNIKAFTPTEAGRLEFFDTERASLDIGAGGFLEADEREFPLGDIEEARKGNKIIYVWGLVKYRDVFHRCQFASFAFRSGIKIDQDKWILRGFTNGSTIVSDYPDSSKCQKDGKTAEMPPAIFLPPK